MPAKYPWLFTEAAPFLSENRRVELASEEREDRGGVAERDSLASPSKREE